MKDSLSLTARTAGSDDKPLEPLSFAASLPFFALPAAALAASIYILWPYLMEHGFSRLAAYAVSMCLPMAGLIVASLLAYALEGREATLRAFAGRMRLKLPGRTDWLLTAGGTVAFLAASVLANGLLAFVLKLSGFVAPDFRSGASTALIPAVVLLFNVAGEELWWRGIILPRQEAALGRLAWLVHGVLWACFHAFKWWAVPAMMVTCPIMTWVAWKTKNTWTIAIMHFVTNGIGVAVLLLSGLK